MARVSFILLLGIAGIVQPVFGSPEQKLENLGIELPEVSPSIANYVGGVRTGDLLFLSGHLPRDEAGGVLNGKVGGGMGGGGGSCRGRRTGHCPRPHPKGGRGGLGKGVRGGQGL
ncbi:MAG: hypothetical protein AB3N33_10040, partial [Puniceicoccaceae bacterium]